jgi:Domain of unknown function (DUF4136)
MKALHPLPTLSALNSVLASFTMHFRALAQWNVVQEATKYVALCLLSMVALVQLTGCASVRLIDNDVSTFSSLSAVPAGSTYRFERLPSQQTNPQLQDQLEAIAQASLAKVGLLRVGDAPGSAAARYSVQMGINVQSVDYTPWDDFGPRFGGYVGIGSGPFLVGRRGYGHVYGQFGYPLMYMPPPPNYLREVSLVLRDTASNKVVFETHARHEGPWADTLAILPAMFDAALQGFPAPPAGPRRVNVEIPR